MMRRRHGTIYVTVLGMSLLVAVIAIGAIAAVRSNARSRDRASDADEARYYALSATEMARLWISQDSNWRNDYQNGTWINSQPIGSGTLSVNVVNPNGALNNSDLDPVNITATGTKGIASQMMSVTLTPNPTPLSCLGVAVDCAGSTSISNGTVRGLGTFSSGGTLSASSTSFDGNNLEGLLVVPVSCTGVGTVSSLSAARTVPSATVFNYYTQHGTSISFNSIPSGTIENVVLSPGSNPYGSSADPNGIYIIDCGNQSITVRNCRIVGTLVLLNTTTSAKVDQSVNFAPSISNYPTLLVQGPMQFTFGSTALSESSVGNMNPPGTPYAGVSNTTATDTYPSQIAGLVYISGNTTINTAATFNGCLVVGGTLNVTQSINVTLDLTFYKNPPPGFIVTPPPMVITSGTWNQVVN